MTWDELSEMGVRFIFITLAAQHAMGYAFSFLLEDLKDEGISINGLAQAIRVPANRISLIVNGKRAISADTAVRLGKYFGLPAQFWLNLQNDYDLRLAEGSGIGSKIKPRKAAYSGELTGTR